MVRSALLLGLLAVVASDSKAAAPSKPKSPGAVGSKPSQVPDACEEDTDSPQEEEIASQRTMSKVAPHRIIFGALQRLSGSSAELSPRGEQQHRQDRSVILTASIMVLRLAVSFAVMYWQQRRQAAATGEGPSAFANAFSSGPLAPIITAIASCWQSLITKLADFARSPHSAPVMMTLLIGLVQVIKGYDADLRAFESGPDHHVGDAAEAKEGGGQAEGEEDQEGEDPAEGEDERDAGTAADGGAADEAT